MRWASVTPISSMCWRRRDCQRGLGNGGIRLEACSKKPALFASVPNCGTAPFSSDQFPVILKFGGLDVYKRQRNVYCIRLISAECIDWRDGCISRHMIGQQIFPVVFAKQKPLIDR